MHVVTTLVMAIALFQAPYIDVSKVRAKHLDATTRSIEINGIRLVLGSKAVPDSVTMTMTVLEQTVRMMVTHVTSMPSIEVLKEPTIQEDGSYTAYLHWDGDIPEHTQSVDGMARVTFAAVVWRDGKQTTVTSRDVVVDVRY